MARSDHCYATRWPPQAAFAINYTCKGIDEPGISLLNVFVCVSSRNYLKMRAIVAVDVAGPISIDLVPLQHQNSVDEVDHATTQFENRELS
jgi:hypothetical protein